MAFQSHFPGHHHKIPFFCSPIESIGLLIFIDAMHIDCGYIDMHNTDITI